MRLILWAFTILVVLQFVSPDASAQGLRGILDDIVRKTMKVADDVPVARMDDISSQLAKSKSAREVVDTELGQFSRLKGASRSDEVLKLLRAATTQLDPSMVRRLKQLDGPARETALILAKGGDQLSKNIPDLAVRGKFLKEAGPETVAAVGMFGPECVHAALKLDAALQTGKLLIKPGGAAVSLADFGKVMIRSGDSSWSFWTRYVRPHWKFWAASGALAAYLTNPDFFQDAAGNLTEAGFRHLTEFVGEVTASAIRGVGQGSGKAVEMVTVAANETFLDLSHGGYAVLGVTVLFCAFLLLFRRVRAWFLFPFFWLNQKPVK